MYRFQAVPHIGQGALNNDTHGLVDIGFLHFLFDVDRNDFASCDGLTFILLIVHVVTHPFLRPSPWKAVLAIYPYLSGLTDRASYLKNTS